MLNASVHLTQKSQGTVTFSKGMMSGSRSSQTFKPIGMLLKMFATLLLVGMNVEGSLWSSISGSALTIKL